MRNSLHYLILKRLLLAWLVLSVLVGGAIYWLETQRIDDEVIALIQRESPISSDDVEAMLRKAPQLYQTLARKAEGLVEKHFTIVEIYDTNEEHLVATHRPGSARLEQELERRHHSFPLDAALHYERFSIEGEEYLQVLLPLRTQAGKLGGYLEGVYHIDAPTLQGINRRVYRTLVMVLLVILATSVFLYPVILLLNRQLLRFSRETLRDNIKLMEVLGGAIAARDSDTNAHNYRVTLYAIHLARALKLPSETIRNLIAGAFLHDVGKIGISDAILCKPGPLTPQEFAVMREHVRLGLEIVCKANWLKGALDVIEFHHEKYDGSGYLRGLKKMEIPLTARIFTVVDVFDALTSRRPYKEPYPLQKALSMLRDGAGKDFDPALIAVFEEIAPALYADYANADEDVLEAALMKRVECFFIEDRLGRL